jgi:hypothetical protein
MAPSMKENSKKVLTMDTGACRIVERNDSDLFSVQYVVLVIGGLILLLISSQDLPVAGAGAI